MAQTDSGLSHTHACAIHPVALGGTNGFLRGPGTGPVALASGLRCAETHMGSLDQSLDDY